MATIQAELYEAFISVGADKEKAKAAAESVARITTDYPKPEELATKEYIDKKIAELETRLTHRLWLQSISIIAVIIGMNLL